jgi:iron-only hydrogenase group A
LHCSALCACHKHNQFSQLAFLATLYHSVALSEEFGLEPGAYTPGHLVAALKALGFDLVLDTNTAADLTVCEEATELLDRLKARVLHTSEPLGETTMHTARPLPLFTSCCPGWMNLVEKSYPELAQYVSTCKSPHMMLGALIKEYAADWYDRPALEVYLCSIMPCVRKRGESDQPAFVNLPPQSSLDAPIRHVDNVLTTRDLGQLLREYSHVDPVNLTPLPFDPIFAKTDGKGSGAGQLFGATGGVMEAAVRTAYEVISGQPLPCLELEAVRGLEGVKEAVLKIPLPETDTVFRNGDNNELELRVAVANGLGSAKTLIKKLKAGEVAYDFIEVMACPGGCIGGGGQPKGDKEALSKRLNVIYELDRNLPRRKSHDNPTIKQLYDEKLGYYGSSKAHDLLHVEPVYGTVPKVPDDVQKLP